MLNPREFLHSLFDGSGGNAATATLERVKAQDVDARACLGENDAYGFFKALGDLVVSGPTCTHVNDFRAILITP